MKTRSRQDAIVRSLRRNGTATIQTLGYDVGASRSTILRDIAALRDEGFAIHSEPGRGGGLYLDPQSVQTAARLTVAEVFALIVSVSSVRAAGQLPFSDLADTGLAKIEKALPSDKVRDLRRLLECLYVGPLAPQIDISNLGHMDPALLPAFESAFLKQQCLPISVSRRQRGEVRATGRATSNSGSAPALVSGRLGPVPRRFPAFSNGPDQHTRLRRKFDISPATCSL